MCGCIAPEGGWLKFAALGEQLLLKKIFAVIQGDNCYAGPFAKYIND